MEGAEGLVHRRDRAAVVALEVLVVEVVDIAAAVPAGILAFDQEPLETTL